MFFTTLKVFIFWFYGGSKSFFKGSWFFSFVKVFKSIFDISKV